MNRSRAVSILLTLGLATTTVARGQAITGYTTLDIDPSSGIVTATCDTYMDADTDSFYEASVR